MLLNLLFVVWCVLLWTCWLWPIVFVDNLFKCIKAIVNHQDEGEYEAQFKKQAWWAKGSLICMIVLLVIGMTGWIR